jgi:hypothetical protein
MPKNFDASTDAMVNAYFADVLVVANKVWLVLLDENEASIATDDTFADLTWSTSQKIAVTSISCVDRVVDLGGPHIFTGTVETPASVAVLTDDPTGTPLMLYVQNLKPGGTAHNFATGGDAKVNALLFRHGFQDEV